MISGFGNRTAIEILQNMNPEVVNPRNLKIGIILKYKKRRHKTYNYRLEDISTMSIAKNYNGNGDTTYCAKLNYVLQFLRKEK
ncbi:hypothetical protein BGH94_08760 [Snodgrassella alvi]|nr:hypothetical protein BGH94_08760 [Snodgrassella alvi]ORE99869.1 hypothetical protein BGH95_11460 [Snodgrassella alvi]